ncbi:MAG: hypothetical protein NTW10_14945 [Bacteroidetes bacterium]|nr:hypothetical protein [Bacteroidota bacterium]
MRSFFCRKFILVLLLWTTLSPWIMGQQAGTVPGKGLFTMAVFDSSFEKALYKGSLDISKHHLTGLFYLKKVSENSVRVVFSNEMGMTFFDLEIKNDKLIVHSIFPSMNKSSLLKLLRSDFRLLMVPDTTVKKSKQAASDDSGSILFKIKSARGSFYYTYDKLTDRISRIRTSGAIMGKTDLQVTRDSRLQPKKIEIANPVIGLHIQMTFLGN